MMPTLAALYRYPLKSGQAQALRQSSVTPQGLPQDRDWMVATPEGQYITGRTHPQILLITAKPSEDGIHFSAPAMSDLFVPHSAMQHQQQADVWEVLFSARSGSLDANAWFSAYLAQNVILMWIGLESHRYVKNRPEVPISFSDGYPLLLIGEGSLKELNRRAGQEFDMLRFRPNLVVRNTEAFAEDQWKLIRIGGVEFEIAKPCERCVMITLDPQNAEKDRMQEPLRTLAKFRKFPEGVLFGQNIIAKSYGQIQLGMPVEILS